MAVQYADLSRLDAILKDRPLQDAIRTAMNKATPFAEKITQELPLSGRKGIFPVQFGVNEGIYARPEKGTFGESRVDTPELAEVTAKYIYATFEITGQIMSSSRDNPGAFEEGLALTIENTIDGLKLDMARQMIGDGSGKIANVLSRTDADTLVLIDPFGLSTYKSNRPVRNILRKNMPIDVIDSDGSTVNVTNGLVSALTHTSASTTMDWTGTETATPAVDDFIVRNGNLSNEINGFLGGIGTTGTYLAIPRAGLDGWQGVQVDAAGGGAATVALDPDHLRDTVDLIMETTGEEPEFLVMNYKQRRNFYNLVAPQIRYAPMMAPQGLTESALTFDNMPVIIERFFPPEHIGVVNSRYWYHAIDKEVEWIRGIDGTVLHFPLTQDVFKAVLRSYRNLACLYPATNGLIYGLEE